MKHRCRNGRRIFCCAGLHGLLGASAFGLLVIIICVSGFSLLVSCFNASDDLVSCMSALALCAGSFAAGFSYARHKRRHGLLAGFGAGAVIYLAVFIFGLILMKSFSGAGTFMKLIMIILCSCIGGVCGVNTRINKPPVCKNKQRE